VAGWFIAQAPGVPLHVCGGSGLQNSTTCAVGFFRLGFFRRRFRSMTAHISSRKSVSSAKYRSQSRPKRLKAKRTGGLARAMQGKLC
jgi:hypothetical protein